jgi:hypothetical protein
MVAASSNAKGYERPGTRNVLLQSASSNRVARSSSTDASLLEVYGQSSTQCESACLRKRVEGGWTSEKRRRRQWRWVG